MAKFGTLIWVTLIAIFAAFLIIPQTHTLFVNTTSAHPYLMGFVKFAILSTMGEFLAARIVSGRWQMVKGMLPKMFIWGILGVLIVMMFSIYADGVSGAINKGLLWTGSPAGGSGTASAPGLVAGGFLAKLLKAFYISAIMNLTFAPVFMASHRITDTWIDARFVSKGISVSKGMSVSKVIATVDWGGFMKFVVGKTIPLFWIPAHTITFLLPDTYKVIFAASLSIVLGLILSIAKSR
ncbi:MAG: hypothetical protein AB9922_05515 [Bacteroidales bacterium]